MTATPSSTVATITSRRIGGYSKRQHRHKRFSFVVVQHILELLRQRCWAVLALYGCSRRRSCRVPCSCHQSREHKLQRMQCIRCLQCFYRVWWRGLERSSSAIGIFDCLLVRWSCRSRFQRDVCRSARAAIRHSARPHCNRRLLLQLRRHRVFECHVR